MSHEMGICTQCYEARTRYNCFDASDVLSFLSCCFACAPHNPVAVIPFSTVTAARSMASKSASIRVAENDMYINQMFNTIWRAKVHWRKCRNPTRSKQSTAHTTLSLRQQAALSCPPCWLPALRPEVTTARGPITTPHTWSGRSSWSRRGS